MTDFKVEALSVLNTIHRAVTFGNTREKAHAILKDYHENRFHASAAAFRKANAKAAKYQEGSQKHQKYTAIANNHFSDAQKHSNLFAHHGQAEHDASVDGYEHNEHMNKRMNIMAFNHQQVKQNLQHQAPARPTPQPARLITPKKPPVLPVEPKIKTPKPVRNVATPLEKSLAPDPVKPPAPLKTNRLGKRSNLPNGGKKPNRVPGPTKKPVSIKPLPPAKPIKPPTIKATPRVKPKPIKFA